MTRDFTCKEHLFLMTEALETWIWVFGIGMGAALVILIFSYIRLRGDFAALDRLLRG